MRKEAWAQRSRSERWDGGGEADPTQVAPPNPIALIAARRDIAGLLADFEQTHTIDDSLAAVVAAIKRFEADLQSGAARIDREDFAEAFADPLFEDEDLTSVDVREMATASPQASRAVLSLYKAYQAARETADNLSSKLAGGEDLGVVDRSHIPTEEVSDFIQKMSNFVPELEAGTPSVIVVGSA